MKLAVSIGLAIFWWLVGYSVGVEMADVVAGTSRWAVACKQRVAESDEYGTAALRETRLEREVVVRDLEEAALAVTDTVRGTARRAGMERAIDRQAAMMN